MSDECKWVVVWQIDYSFRGEGFEEGVEVFDEISDATEFIKNGLEENKPRYERVYPNGREVVKHHPGFHAELYRSKHVSSYGKK